MRVLRHHVMVFSIFEIIFWPTLMQNCVFQKSFITHTLQITTYNIVIMINVYKYFTCSVDPGKPGGTIRASKAVQP